MTSVRGRQAAPFLLHIGLRGRSGIHIEMVAPAGEFEAVIAHRLCERSQFFKREIGPLAGEEGDRS